MSIDKKNTFKLLPLMGMLYVTIIIAANVLIFRMTEFDNLEFSTGVFLIPIWFILADIITEVYGYSQCKKIIWYCLFCTIIFGFISLISIYLPIPQNWPYSPDYFYILSNQLKIAIILIIAVVPGGFINTFLVSKWKVMVQGKLFFIRCIGASWVGQLVFTLVTVLLNFYDKLPAKKIIIYMCISYPEKMLITTILAFPALYVVSILKEIEGINNLDSQIKFNPFSNKTL